MNGVKKLSYFFTLSQKNVSDSRVDVILSWISRLDHVSISKLHALCSLCSELSGYGDFTILCTVLHDKSKKKSIFFDTNLALLTDLCSSHSDAMQKKKKIQKKKRGISWIL